MLRCDRCGGRAVASLGHLHGLTETLCHDCTQGVVARRETAKLESTLVAAAKVDVTRTHLRELSDRQNYFGDFYAGPSLEELEAA